MPKPASTRSRDDAGTPKTPFALVKSCLEMVTTPQEVRTFSF
jgi:hypothetical protein